MGPRQGLRQAGRPHRLDLPRPEDPGDKAYLFFDQDPIVYERWKHIERNAFWQVLPCPREGNAEFKGFIVAGDDRRFYPAKARHVRLDDVPCIEVTSDLVEAPVAVRYGWASWPTGNMVGRERLPMPTFRTDDWPLPVGVSHDKQAQQVAAKELKRLRDVAERQVLDRKIRQMQHDLPELEKKLHSGQAHDLVGSKLARIEGILREMKEDRWLANRLKGEQALGENLAKLAKAMAEAQAALEAAKKK